MTTYRVLNELNIAFLTDRTGFSEEDVKIEESVMEWYHQIPDSESGYLVDIEGIKGFLYILEADHMGQVRGSEGYRYSRLHGSRTDEGVFELLTEVAEEIQNEVSPYGIYLGRATGFEECHELCLFFPYNSNVHDIEKKAEQAIKVYREMGKSKWNSFTDLMEMLPY